MAPKPRGGKSSAVVPTGRKDVWHDSGHGPNRKQGGIKPSTERALVLRNGKHGVQGTGEVIMFTKMQGREKLELLAEDLMKQTAQALGVKIDLERCEKIAHSQFLANVDEINNLQDPDLFMDIARIEIQARKDPKEDPYKNPTKVAEYIAAMIHNSYMLASSWKLVYQYLRQIRRTGVEDGSLRAQLAANEELRTKYLVLYDVVNNLTSLNQKKMSLLATTSHHFKEFFTRNAHYEKNGEPEYVFNWAKLRDLQKSFLDSIVVELCLPDSRIPKNILYLLLREAVDEASKKAKEYFPQALWDAVGDLSVSVQLQEMLESVLLGPEGEKWKKELDQFPLPQEYDDWLDAQALPVEQKLYIANWKDIIHPLERTRSRNVLDDMWRYINLNYTAFTGKDIDTLWHLEEVHQRTPQWHASKADGKAAKADTDDPPGLVPYKGKKTSGSQRGSGGKLAITNDDGDDSDGSMPSLQTVSDSSEAETDYDGSEYETDDEDVEYDEDEEYDEEDEDILRELAREAMDAASTVPDFYDPKATAPEIDELAEERKSNPFIKLLGALRGRMFSGDPTLRSSKRTEPSRPFPSGKPPPAGKAPPRPTAKPTAKSQKATVGDEAEDEEGGTPSASKKKKKKKPKKKKKKPTEGGEQVDGAADGPSATPVSPAPSTPAPAPTSPESKKKETPKPQPKPARPASVASSINAMPFGGSTTSLPGSSAAQSARKYLQEEGIEEKNKLKSRPNFGNLAPIPEKKSIFAKFKKDKTEEPEEKGDKHSFFSTLGKKTKSYMHQLLNTAEDEKKGLAPMKWENFLKVMREMGFEYDPSTAGSSVRFDPPNRKDPPITFHKPHPDPTLQPLLLKQYGKRLKRAYGWSEEDFYRRMS